MQHQMMRVGHRLQTGRCGRRGGSPTGTVIWWIHRDRFSETVRGSDNMTSRQGSDKTTKVSVFVQVEVVLKFSEEWEVFKRLGVAREQVRQAGIRPRKSRLRLDQKYGSSDVFLLLSNEARLFKKKI